MRPTVVGATFTVALDATVTPGATVAPGATVTPGAATAPGASMATAFGFRATARCLLRNLDKIFAESKKY